VLAASLLLREGNPNETRPSVGRHVEAELLTPPAKIGDLDRDPGDLDAAPLPNGDGLFSASQPVLKSPRPSPPYSLAELDRP
jgi:hypothetical protein